MTYINFMPSIGVIKNNSTSEGENFEVIMARNPVQISKIDNKNAVNNDLGAKTLESLKAFANVQNKNMIFKKAGDKNRHFGFNVKKWDLKSGYDVKCTIFDKPDYNEQLPGEYAKISIYKNANENKGDLALRIFKDKILVRQSFPANDSEARDPYIVELELKGSIDFSRGLDNLYFLPKNSSLKNAKAINQMMAKALNNEKYKHKVYVQNEEKERQEIEQEQARTRQKNEEDSNTHCVPLVGCFRYERKDPSLNRD